MDNFVAYNQHAATVAAQAFQKREANRATDIENLRAKIDAVGMEEFCRIFFEAHEKEKFYLEPEEFSLNQPEEIAGAFREAYHRELRAFHEKILRQWLPTFKSEHVARVLIILSEKDVPKTLIDEKLDQAIAHKRNE